MILLFVILDIDLIQETKKGKYIKCVTFKNLLNTALTTYTYRSANVMTEKINRDADLISKREDYETFIESVMLSMDMVQNFYRLANLCIHSF